jgi:hypothetical protein
MKVDRLMKFMDNMLKTSTGQVAIEKTPELVCVD